MHTFRRVPHASGLASFVCVHLLWLVAGSSVSAQPTHPPSPEAAAPVVRDVQALVVAGGREGSGAVRMLTTERVVVSGLPWGPRFTGGVRVATGDVNGDGVVDLVVGTGPGAGSVRVFSGVDAAPLLNLAPFGESFVGGVYVAAGDVNGDGRDDVIVGGSSRSGEVRVFSGADGSDLGRGHPFGAVYDLGVTVATGDVNGDGRTDVITGTAFGGYLRVFSGLDYSPLTAGFPYGPLFTGGVTVAAGDFDGDGRAELVTGALTGTAPVQLLNGADVRVLLRFDPFPGANGMSVAVADVNDDGRLDLVMGAGPGDMPRIRVLSGVDASKLVDTLAFDPSFRGGVFVAGLARAAVRFTSPTEALFTVGTADTFVVTTAGGDGLTLSVDGPLPAGLTFTDQGDGTAHLAGTPADGTAGPHALQFRASRGSAVVATQDVTLTIQQTPAITSPTSVTFTEDQAGTFDVTTTGFPAPALSVSGTLPTGVTFVDQGDGTARLSGTPPTGTAGTYALTVSATNGAGTSTQALTLFVSGTIPIFTSPASTTFVVGTAGSFGITATASPAVTSITVTGTLPGGVTFTDHGDGTATLAGTPAPATAGTHTLTFTASNGVGTTLQTFTLTIQQAAAFTSAASTAFTVGTPGTFTVTTTGLPVPSIGLTGTLPAGVTFVDNGDGTATLAGTPTAPGTFALTLTAQNGVGSPATQNFTLTSQAPGVFTSAASATFLVGTAGSFAVATAGTPPVSSLTLTGGIPPAGVSFTPGGANALLAGTPATGEGGIYPLVFTATNGVGAPVTQNFTLTVNEAPSFTSPASTTFGVGVAGSFTVTALGFPAASITLGGDLLPAGLTFADNGDGTATLSGTANPGTFGTYNLTFTATNGIGAAVVQPFTLTVAGIAVTSADTTTFTVGAAGNFTVTTAGTPPVTSIARTGNPLPAGVTYTDNADGTATLAGIPAATMGGSYTFTLTADNGTTTIDQIFTLIVQEAPLITSATATTFAVGTPGTFTVTTTGFPAPTLTQGGVALPAGITFTDNGNGTGTLAGMPAADTGGTFAISFTAANGIGTDAVQAFTLTVQQAPVFTSAATTTFVVGQPGTFNITTSGFPAVTTITGGGAALPAGVTYLDNGDGTATLSGTPNAGTGGAYALVFRIDNGVGGEVIQNFTLNVHEAPAITSATSVTFTVGQAGSFEVTTTGSPAPTVSVTGTLPSGVTFTPGTRLLAGTPAAGAHTDSPYALQFTAANGVTPDAVQAFTLNVVCPVITVTPAAGALPDGIFNQAYAQTFTASGGTGPYTFTVTAGALPDGTALATGGALTGTLTNTGVFGFTVTATDSFACTGTASYTATIRPNVQPDTYSGGVGNVEMRVGVAPGATPSVVLAGTVLDNDQGPALTITTPSPIATTNGGQVLITATGSFTYQPQAGDTGNDTFQYTVSSNGVTNTGTVTLGVSGLVWFVRAGAAGGGDGRSHLPFNTLDAAATPSASGSTIYVHTGTGNTTGNLALDATQILHGAGEAFTLNSLSIAAAGRPTLTGTVTLNDNTLVTGLNFSGASPAMAASGSFSLPTAINQVMVSGGTSALSLTNLSATGTGALTVSNALFSNTSGAEIAISGGNIPVTIASSVIISSNAGRSIDIQNRTGGTVTFQGTITDTGQGIFLNANTGSTIAFTGGLNLSTGTNPAFTATGGGTVTATQNNTTIVNTITTTTGVGLNVANTTIGAAGLTFRSISVNGAANGIVLNTTGSTGGLTVSGDGGTSNNGSGGTIQNTTGVGISLTSTSSVNLGYINLSNSGDDGIRGQGVTGFTLNRSNLTNNGNATAENGLQFGEPSGTVAGITGILTITNTNITGSAGNNVHIRNTSGTLASMSVTGSTFNNLNDTTGANSFLFEMSGTAVTTAATISGSTFANNSPQRALEVQVHDTGTISDFDVTSNTFTDNGIHASFTQDAAANMTFSMLTNTMTFANPLHAINVFSSALSTGGTIVGTIQGNTIGTSGVANSGARGNAIRAFIQGRTVATLLIDGNTIRQVWDTGNGARGIDLQFVGPTTTGQGITQSDVTIANNDVDTQAPASSFPLAAIYLAADDQGSPARVRANVTGNTAQNSVGGGSFDYPGFDGNGAHLIFVDVGGAAEGQLVNTTGAANATVQLTNANPGTAAARIFQQDIVLIAGPINTP